jgi:probable FeS assembly SUF system protein SufT
MTGANKGDAITLHRPCFATTVPQGERITLDAGTEVTMVQQMGGSYTVKSEMGTLLRIDGSDADALGLEPTEVERRVTLVGSGPFSMDNVTDALHTVYDPEIPVSIVDLGLVYRCEEVVADDGTRRIDIDMTMTSPGCGMGDVLVGDAIRAVERVPGVDEVRVEMVFDPPWSMEHMSEEARLQLGML